MSERPIWLIGAGGHVKIVLEALASVAVSAIEVFDDAPVRAGMRLRDVMVRNPVPDLAAWNSAGAVGHLAIGDNAARAALAARLPVRWTDIRHVSAFVADDAEIAPGAFIATRAVVHPGARIGAHTIVNTGAIVEHDCILGDFVHIAPGAVLTGAVRVGRATLVGAGTVVRPGVTIGAGAVCGAGSVVVADVPDGATVMGVPARPRTLVLRL